MADGQPPLGTIRPARDAVEALATLVRRGDAWDWLPRLPKWLDPLSTVIALKTCVGLVIGVSIAFWLGWSATGVGFACIMLQTAYLGRTLGRGILRMAGALVGSVLALVFISTLVQERALLIGAYALVTGVIIYAEQLSDHPYALLFVLLSVGLITFDTINDPQAAFDEAVSWVSGNALGITIVLFMHGVLWPHTGESSFERQLSTFIQGLSQLFTLKMATMPLEAQEQDPTSREANLAEIHELEHRLMAALAPMRLALGIASRDTERFIRFEAAYADLVDRLHSLTSVIMAYGDSLRIWRDTALAATVLPQSPAPQIVKTTIQGQLEDLAAGCEQPRDGTNPSDAQSASRAVVDQIEALRRSLGTHEHSVLEAALFDAVSEKALEVSRTVAAVREALATVEQPGKRIAHAQPAQVDVITQIQSPGLRLRKAAIGMIAVVVASLLWINLNWPDPGSLLVFVLLPVALNAMVPVFPVKGALQSLFWGPVIGGLLYFVLMPPLTDMWQLAPILILCLFPTTYLTNSPNPSTMMAGLLTSLWTFLLIDISQGQVYSFSQFANMVIGITGGVGVALAALVLLDPANPERQFKANLRAFLRRCERAIADLPHAPRPAGGQNEIEAKRAEWIELLGMCGLWAQQLDPGRHPEDERARLRGFMASLRSLAFRLEALEQARVRYPDQTLIEAPSERCCADAVDTLRRLRQNVTAPVPSDGPDAPMASADIFRGALEPLHEQAHQGQGIDHTLRAALTLTGYYCALADAVEETRQSALQIDWRKWDLAYF